MLVRVVLALGRSVARVCSLRSLKCLFYFEWKCSQVFNIALGFLVFFFKSQFFKTVDCFLESFCPVLKQAMRNRFIVSFSRKPESETCSELVLKRYSVQ